MKFLKHLKNIFSIKTARTHFTITEINGTKIGLITDPIIGIAATIGQTNIMIGQMIIMIGQTNTIAIASIPTQISGKMNQQDEEIIHVRHILTS